MILDRRWRRERKEKKRGLSSFGMSGERKSDWWKVKAHAHARTRPPACLYAHHQAPAAELLFAGPHLDASGS